MHFLSVCLHTSKHENMCCVIKGNLKGIKTFLIELFAKEMQFSLMEVY